MTTRRLPHTPAAPSLTGGDDETPPTPCVEDVARRLEVRSVTGIYDPSPYDVLMDKTEGPAYNDALRKAVKMCRSCPLEVAAKCFTDNAGESWVKAIREAKHAPRNRPECGTSWGIRKHAAAKEHTCAACKGFTREKESARREKRRAA